MRFLKRTILTILFLTTVGVLFRGWIYRSLVIYKSIGQRTNYSVTDAKLINYINTGTEKLDDPEIEQIIKIGLSITSRQLNFNADKNDIDPNKLVTSKTAHCIGYSIFFATTCNYLLYKYNLSGNWIARPQIGQLYLLGTNIHKYFNSPFFKDHDFVTIENKTTGEIFAVDPTVSDYLKIDFISYEK